MKVGKTGGNVAAAIYYYPCYYYFAFASDGLVVILFLTGVNRKDGSASRCETVGKLQHRPFGENRKNKSMVSSGRLLLQLSVDMQR